MHSLLASVLVLVALLVAAGGIVYWQPDGFVGLIFAGIILGLAFVVERAARRGGA